LFGKNAIKTQKFFHFFFFIAFLVSFTTYVSRALSLAREKKRGETMEGTQAGMTMMSGGKEMQSSLNDKVKDFAKY
jgi:hypothetical protein